MALLAGGSTIAGVWKRRRTLRRIAAAFGMNSMVGFSSRINMEVDGLQISVVASGVFDDEPVQIQLVGAFARLNLRLRPTRLVRSAIEPDILVGDADFDSAVIVQGSETEVLGALRWPVRRAALPLVRNGMDIDIIGRRLTVSCLGVPASADKTLVEEIVNLAKALPGESSVAERLAQNVREDPFGGVRLRSLEALVSDFGGSAQSQACCRDALADRNPWVRLQAARGLGAEGVDALADLARRSALNEAVASEALQDFLSHATRERAAEVCIDVLASGIGDARRRAIEVLGRLRHAPAMGGLIRAIAGADAPAAEAAARALGLLGGTAAEAALLESLERPHRGTREAAVRSLGDMGTVRSVAPLREFADTGDAGSALRRIAREAIARIQSRLVGAEAGQVALADVDPQRGSVSLVTADTEEGRVSLAEAPRSEKT
jgi:HEAT repeat protein